MTELILLIFGTRNYCVQFLSYRKSSIRLPLSGVCWGGGGLIYFKHILGRGGLNREGGAKTMVLVLPKKAQVQGVGGHAAEDRKQIRNSSK